jgi:hypothetical protein
MESLARSEQTARDTIGPAQRTPSTFRQRPAKRSAKPARGAAGSARILRNDSRRRTGPKQTHRNHCVARIGHNRVSLKEAAVSVNRLFASPSGFSFAACDPGRPIPAECGRRPLRPSGPRPAEGEGGQGRSAAQCRISAVTARAARKAAPRPRLQSAPTWRRFPKKSRPQAGLCGLAVR